MRVLSLPGQAQPPYLAINQVFVKPSGPALRLARFLIERVAFDTKEDLVCLELVLVILGEMLRLLSLAQNRVPYNKRIHLGTHEAAKRVLGRANSGLATHFKARVDEDGAIGPTLRPNQPSQ